ncbi:hypothetical protein Aperf_G00000092581 [Anoplocephala perfoliata]
MGQAQSSKGGHSNAPTSGELTPTVAREPKIYRDNSLPVRKRHCTDVICCLAFLISISMLGVLAGFSFAMGDYRRIVFPKDSRSKICGLDYPDRNHLYFFDLLSCLDVPEVVIQFGCPTKQVCVSNCPNYSWTPSQGDSFESRSLMICEDGKSGNYDGYKSKTVDELIDSKACAPKVIPTKTMLGRCVPQGLFTELEARNRRLLANPKSEKAPPSFQAIVFGARTVVTRMIEDLVRSWKVILTCLLVAAAVSFLWIVLLEFCTCAMVYFTLVVFIALFGLATGFCFWRYVETKKLTMQPAPFYFTFDLTVYFRYSTTWLVLGIISAVVLLIVLLIIIFLRKKIALANRVLREASKAIGHMPFTLFWPIVPFTFILGTIALWFFVDLNIRSIAIAEGVSFNRSQPEPKSMFSKQWIDWVFKNAMKCDPTGNYSQGQFCFYVRHVVTNYTPWLQVYNFAVCLWLINYFIAVDRMTLAGTFAKFYFSQHQQRRRGGSCSCHFFGVFLILGTCVSAVFFNTGSLALGSFLITLLCLIRAILLKLERRLKMADNEIAKFFIKCLCCCFWCLDKFLRFLNKNAYIMMAIYGHSFCRSARDAFALIVRNVVRVFVVDKITDFILFVGKLVVSAAASCLAYAYLSGVISDHLAIVPEQNLELNYLIVPILIIGVGSYLIAKAFFTVYEMGVDTIFICVCEDLELNDGSEEKPYLMSRSMMKALKRSESVDGDPH